MRLLGPATEKYPALNAVRAVGASAVFFDHLPFRPDLHIVINTLSFFFVLSGFLITRLYYEQAVHSRDWWRRYLANRYARIYPLYFLLLTVAVFSYHEFRPWVLWTNYTLTHALFRGVPLLIQPSWSLTVEECFYLLAPVLMLLARRRHVLAPVALCCGLLALALAISRLHARFLGGSLFVLTTTFFGHCAEFLVGFYLALLLIRRERVAVTPRPGIRYTLAGLISTALLSWAMVLVYRRTPLNFAAIVLINNFLMPLPIALLYWGLIRETSPISWLLSSPLVRLFGRGSYSFYLLQMLLIDFVGIPWSHSLGSRAWASLLTFVLTWVVAIALFVCYEQPLNLLIRRQAGSIAGRAGALAVPMSRAADRGLP